MIRRPPRSTQSRSSAASDVYKRQEYGGPDSAGSVCGLRGGQRGASRSEISPVVGRVRAERSGPNLLGGGGEGGHGVGGCERGLRLCPAAHIERRRTKTEERVHLLLPRLRVRESGLAGAEGLCGISLPEERALSHGKRVIQAPLVCGGLERASGQIDLPERFGVVPAAAVELPGHEPRPRLGAAGLRWQPVQPGAQPLSGQAFQPRFAASCDGAESVKRLVGVQVELHCHLSLADVFERGRRLVLEAAERRLAFFLEVSLPQEVAEEIVVAVRALLARREGEDAVRREMGEVAVRRIRACLLYTSPSP